MGLPLDSTRVGAVVASEDLSAPLAGSTRCASMRPCNVTMRLQQPDVAPESRLVIFPELVSSDAADAVVTECEWTTQSLHGSDIKRSIVECLVALGPVPVKQSQTTMLFGVGTEDAPHQPAAVRPTYSRAEHRHEAFDARNSNASFVDGQLRE